MVNFLLTVDVEIWCGGWDRLDETFPDAFRRYVYGPTSSGPYGLPLQLKMLAEHGLKAVFFVEPLFATRFGVGPLAEIVGLITEAGQEVQLHLHTEWVDEAVEPLLTSVDGKRQFLRQFSLADQVTLIEKGKALLSEAGAPGVRAFRAGSFGMNRETLLALGHAKIPIDSSFNFAQFARSREGSLAEPLLQPTILSDVHEYPLSFFREPWGRYRHLQLGACSSAEIEELLRHAADSDWEAVVMLSHNFELMNGAKTAPDEVVVRRFQRLCKFLHRHRDEFKTGGFVTRSRDSEVAQPPVPRSRLLSTVTRFAEQALRRLSWQRTASTCPRRP